MELFRAIAWNFSVSVGTVYYICKLFEQTGSVDPSKPDRTCTVIGLLMENPSLYLGEVCHRIEDITGI